MSIAVKVENLSKAYQIGQIGTGTISQDLERWWLTKVMRKEDPFLKLGETNDQSVKGKGNIVWSLKDINFEIEQGDAVGIIGSNGAGKSTLLKLISQVTAPTTGRIKIKGRVASLLEIGTGFHPELTGKENIYLNGSILGMQKKEINRKLDEIIEFSGIERYIDTPVKRYSSGMYVRLAFAVAAHLESEILIVDEVLAVGDAKFQKQCLSKMGNINNIEGRTVLFVSHNLSSIMQLCKNGMILKDGKIEYTGDSEKCIKIYIENHSSSEIKAPESKWVKEISIQNNKHEKINFIKPSEEVVIKIDFLAKIWLKNIEIGIRFTSRKQGIHQFMLSTKYSAYKPSLMKPFTSIFCGIKNLHLLPGEYYISVWIEEFGVRVESLERIKDITITESTLPSYSKIPSTSAGHIWVEHQWILGHEDY